MHEFSPADGFVEINENLAEMIKYIANEPSVGLYYIQQHARNAVPNIINLNNNLSEKSHVMALHNEDSEDSIAMVKSMKECGSSITNEMIGDIKNSLAIMSTKQPRRGLILNASPWSRSSFSASSSSYAHDGESSGYFSSVFKTARQRASNIKWPQLDFKEQRVDLEKDEETWQPTPPLSVASGSSNSSVWPDVEGNELPMSNDTVEKVSVDVDPAKGEHILERVNYDEFKASKEANLQAWLGNADGIIGVGKHDTERI